jgi:hypothetical protein
MIGDNCRPEGPGCPVTQMTTDHRPPTSDKFFFGQTMRGNLPLVGGRWSVVISDNN